MNETMRKNVKTRFILGAQFAEAYYNALNSVGEVNGLSFRALTSDLVTIVNGRRTIIQKKGA